MSDRQWKNVIITYLNFRPCSLEIRKALREGELNDYIAKSMPTVSLEIFNHN